MTVTGLLPRALTRGHLLKKLQENVVDLVDKQCGRLRWDFHQTLQEIGRDFRRTWLAKIDDTTQSIRQALERARAQKQTSVQSTAARLGELDQHLEAVLKAEAALFNLRERLQSPLH
ncbi:MAG: hypothetical protein FJ128_14700 [Deltaproteobacteria bacterium]|nr:hypothetical protein [Deltaproteobacteria bacterium]